MNKVFLKSVSAKNFASFAEEVNFTCIADGSKKEHQLNTFKVGDYTINKVSYIYGANGSGKTFFCKIIREIQRIIAVSPLSVIKDTNLKIMFQNDGILDQIKNFAFDINYINKPTTLSIELIIEDTTYHYEFSLLNDKVVYELLTKKNRRTEKILERFSPDFQDIILKSELKSFDYNKKVVKDDALCLVMAAMLNNNFANMILDAIKSINVFNMTSPLLKPVEQKAFSEERIKEYIKILRKADPTIKNMQIIYEEEEIERQKFNIEDFENKEIIKTRTKVDVKTEHFLYDNKIEVESGIDSIDFFKAESMGTIKLFTILPYLFDILEKGGILFVDEIENGFHLSLVKEIINLFSNEESNPNNAQLICTSHQPLLLSENVKKDQVWIVSKDKYGKSSLNRLSNKSFSRTKINIANKILEGSFGCNPDKFFE